MGKSVFCTGGQAGRRRRTRPMTRAVAATLIALLLAVSASGCTRAVAENGPPGPDSHPQPVAPEWRVSDFVPEDLDPTVPLSEARGAYVILNLPHFPLYSVLAVELVDGAVVVHTDLTIPPRTGMFHPWPGFDQVENLQVLEVEQLAGMDSPEVRVLDRDGAALDVPQLGLAQAVHAAQDYAATDFGHLPPYWSLRLDLTEDQPRQFYYLDFSDSQTIDRAGMNAVAGTFCVDASTGEILEDSHLTVVPFGGTRGLTSGSRLLGWTGSDHVLTSSGAALYTYEVDGGLVATVETALDLDGLQFVALDESVAWFEGAGGCLAVDIISGQVRSGTCPQCAGPQGAKTRVVAENSATVTLEISLGGTMGLIRTVEDWQAERAQLTASVTRGGITTTVDTSAMGDHIVLHQWDVDPASETVYFSAELYGPRYGCWVTEYALGALDLDSGEMRRVSRMPGARFLLSPSGDYAVYQWLDRILIIDLSAPGPA